MRSCTRFTGYPEFTMTHAEHLAHDLLDSPTHHSQGDGWIAPMEIRPATTDERCAHLSVTGVTDKSPEVQPLIVCWREGGFGADGDSTTHVFYMPVAEAERRGISEKDLAWATCEVIIDFRMLTQFLPRACALQVIVFELGGYLLPVVQHGQLPARVRTSLR